MKIKGIFFDVDGTLVCHDLGRISENTLKALYALKEKGIRLPGLPDGGYLRGTQ